MRTWCGSLILLGLAGLASDAIASPQIDGGEGYTCALGSSGRAFCWGVNTSGQTGSGLGLPFQSSVSRPTEMAAGFTTVSSSGFHSCGLQADGSAWCWGRNDWGQLGNGKTGQREDLPVRVQASFPFVSISAGAAHTCAIDFRREAWCWGNNQSSQLGRNKVLTPVSTTPIAVLPSGPGSTVTFSSISAGAGHTCGIDFTGVAWCWGSNVNARSGVDINLCGGTTAPPCEFYVPKLTQASAMGLRFSAISAGSANTCAIDTAGTVQCWGERFRGSNLVGRADFPAAVPNVGTSVSVSAGDRSVCSVANTGELFCWGEHFDGQLGDGSPVGSGSVKPVRVVGRQDYASVSVGGTHACGRTLSGEARCWGNNTDGQLGTNVPSGTKVTAPAWVTGLGTSRVTSGYSHTCSLDSAGVVACWGKNTDGQIGHGRASNTPATQSLVPTPVARFYSILPRASFLPPSPPPEALSNTMPSDVKWEVGTMRFTDLAVGGQHACGLGPTGLAYCWGADYLGQVGNGKSTPIMCRYGKESTSSCVPFPTVVSRSDGHNFVDLTAGAGGTHTCGRTASGIVSCWGSARYGELGSTGPTQSGPSGPFQRVPTQIELPYPYRPNMLDVSAGDASTCAVDGSTVFCWGGINWSPAPAPMKFPYGPNYLRVGTGAQHACAGFKNMAMDCIGDNTFGQLGDGSNQYASSAILAANGFPYAPFNASWSFMCGIEPFFNGVDCWGSNYSGELGDGTNTDSNLPVHARLPAGFAAVDVGAGFDHACAIDGKGSAQCWGNNNLSQVGDGFLLGNKSVPTPTAVAAGWFVP